MNAPRKRFGQHFLTDHQVIKRLVDCIQPRPEETLIEIGPGLGALTYPVLERSKRLIAVELDRDLIADLEEKSRAYGELKIHQADALRFDFSQCTSTPQSLRVIGNLPYNISTPLIFHLLTFAPLIKDMCFMLQKEVVDRLAAATNSKDYGRLSVMVQYRCHVTSLFDVPPEAFNPPPKVDSSIVRLVPHQELPHKAQDEALFAELVQLGFNQRRKTLRNSLRTIITDTELWSKLSLDPNLRPEDCSVADFVNLSNQLVLLRNKE